MGRVLYKNNNHVSIIASSLGSFPKKAIQIRTLGMRENEEESTSPVLFLLVLFTNLLLQFFLLLLVVFSKYLRYPVHYSLLYTPLFICCSFASPVLNECATSTI